MSRKLKGILFFLAMTMVSYLMLFSILYLINDDKYDRPFIYNTADYYFKKGGNAWRTFHGFSEPKYDIVVLGSSHAYRGYDPRIFKQAGYNLYNLGTSNETMLNIYHVFNSYITEKNCGLVILDVYDECFLDNGYEFEAAADMIQNMVAPKKNLIDLAWSVQDFRTFNMLTLRFFNSSSQPTGLNETQYVGNGYCETKDSLKYGLNYEPLTEKIDSRKIKYFKKIISRAKQMGLKLVAVNFPNPNKEHRPKHESLILQIKPILNEFNYPLFDYAYTLPLDEKSHYYDYTHLNQSGVNIFNDVLIKDLKKSGF